MNGAPSPRPRRRSRGGLASRRHRTDFVGRVEESWKPPNFSPLDSMPDRLLARARRVVDVQAGSIWTDLSSELAATRGMLLDVGCGAQPYRALVPDGVTYIGIDTAAARKRFGYDVPDTLYFEGDDWPVGDGAADTVLCTETLEHVLEPARFLAEAHRVLAPGGRLILTVPFAARWHYAPYDYWRFTPSALEHLLSVAGFARISVYPRGNAATVAGYKLTALIVPLLMPQGKGRLGRLFSRLAGLALSPLFALSVAFANASLMAGGGDDCLGYTVLAERQAAATR